MSELKKFRRSLCDHPGLTLGAIWPLMLLAGVAMRRDFPGFAEFSGAAWIFLVLVAALPWIPILCTAWTGRQQYAADEASK